jgi:hypothetical protein
MLKGDRFPVLEAAGTDGAAAGGGAGGAGAPAGGGAAAAAGGAPANGGAPGSQGAAAAGAGGSALSQAGAAGADSLDWLPEKYRVVGDDKKVDVAASAKKLAEGYGELAKRLGSAELPPKDAEGYELKADGLPETLKLDELKKDPKFQSFLKSAHGKGMTNAQVQFVMQEFYSRAGELVGGAQALDTDGAIKALREVWKDDAGYQQNMQSAYKAVTALAQKAGLDYAAIEADGLGDNPLFIRLMAAIGGEIGEAPLPGADGGMPSGVDIIDLMRKLQDPKNEKDPQRAEWQRKVDAYYKSRPGASQPVF